MTLSDGSFLSIVSGRSPISLQKGVIYNNKERKQTKYLQETKGDTSTRGPSGLMLCDLDKYSKTTRLMKI